MIVFVFIFQSWVWILAHIGNNEFVGSLKKGKYHVSHGSTLLLCKTFLVQTKLHYPPPNPLYDPPSVSRTPLGHPRGVVVIVHDQKSLCGGK